MEEKANMKNGREKEGGVGKGKRKESERDGIRQERRVETIGEGRKKWRLEREKEKREERKRKGKKNPIHSRGPVMQAIPDKNKNK